MPERQQARLAHQHVVGQRKDRHHADLAHQRQHEAGMAGLAPVVEQERERKQDDEDQQPGPMAAQHAHVSRVPISPRGRNTRISTIIRNGSSAPTRGRVTLSTSANGVLEVTDEAELRQQVGQRDVEHHGEGLDQAHQDRGDEAAGQRAEPAEHDHDEDDRPHGEGHRRLGDLVVAADHAGEPGQRRAGGENQREDARHVVAERGRHVGMGEGGLDHQADAGAGEAEPDRAEHQRRDQPA